MLTLPDAFRDKMKMLMKDEWEVFAEAVEAPAHKGIRYNTLKIDEVAFKKNVSFAKKSVPWCSTGYEIDKEIRPGKHVAYYAGLYYVQEPTAMIPAEVLSPRPGDMVLDLCAAPGGKTTQLACMLNGEGVIVANELVTSRSKILKENTERMGIVNSVLTSAFPEKLLPAFAGSFHKILVDAPCSGEGMFRKNPDAAKEWSPGRVAACAERQKKLMMTVDKLLACGGEVVYSTCTFSPEENEQVMEAMLETGRYDAVPLALPGIVGRGRPEWTLHGTKAVSSALRVMPHEVPGEGHFIAKLRKTADDFDALPSKGKGAKNSAFDRADKKTLKSLKNFCDETGMLYPRGEIFRVGDVLFTPPEGFNAARLSGMRLLRCGIPLAEVKKNRVEPTHTLAMTLSPENFGNVYDTEDDEIAFAYLKGEPLAAPVKGWCLVCWHGFPLGFGKGDGGIIKNHYPKGLRIYKK